MVKSRPTIGLLLDYADGAAGGGFSSRPYYALRTAYFDAVWQAGGLPLAIPYLAEAQAAYLELCDGLIFPGGFYPFPQSVYGKSTPVDEVVHPRHAFELDFMKDARGQDVPTLGICAGMQVMALMDGATLYPDLKAEPGGTIDHLNEKPAEHPAHGVTVKTGTRLHEIVGSATLQVNTAHNEALRTKPETLVVNATSEDGLMEGVEDPRAKFWLGVQWHPEFFPTTGETDFKLFKALIEAAT